jgi:hypothetical protein
MITKNCGARTGAVNLPGESRPLAATLARATLLAWFVFGLAVPRAHADDYFSPTDDRVRISLGAMHVTSDTTLRADTSAGLPGTVINGEDVFGLSKSDFEPKFQAMVRIDTRNRLSFDYFTLDRSGNAIAQMPIVFRNVAFIAGDPLQTKLSLTTLAIAYGYSFWHSETLEIAGTLGVHVTDISAMAKVQTDLRHIIQTDDQAGPVPTLGIDATWVASKRFYFDGRAQYLKVHVDNLDGSLGFYELDALYRYRPNVSFAVGYTAVVAKIASTKSSETGLFDFSTKGPEMFFRVAF